jgi:4-amino-4-deoxy-L-arabinose transferase-like glycosyltransferase
MFLDGVTYASIARNMAEGRGTFWAPSYTYTLYPTFYEHPPLGFWLQSLWFRLLGDHLYVERLYSVAAAALMLLGLAGIWRTVSGEVARRRDEWLPMLFWIAAPVVSWAIVGNLLENTVSVFTAAAVLTAIIAVGSATAPAAAAWGALSGAAIAAACATKGPAGLFPAAAPILYLLVYRKSVSAQRPQIALFGVAAQWLALAAIGLLRATRPESHLFLAKYFHVQLLPSVIGEREVSANRMTILLALIEGVWLPMLAAGALVVLAAGGWLAPSPAERRTALFFFAVGLSGTLPLVVSAKQTGHYLVPAIPYFALAAAAALSATGARLAARAERHTGALAGAGALVAAVALAATPWLGHDRARLGALDRLASSIPRHAVIGICPELQSDWGLHAWFERLFDASLDASAGASRDLFVAASGSACAPAACRSTVGAGAEIRLLRCER